MRPLATAWLRRDGQGDHPFPAMEANPGAWLPEVAQYQEERESAILYTEVPISVHVNVVASVEAPHWKHERREGPPAGPTLAMRERCAGSSEVLRLSAWGR